MLTSRASLQVKGLISKGGFGHVHEGVWTTTSGIRRRVAVKVLDASQDGLDAEARFRDEATLLAQLQHRTFVHFIDMTTVNGQPAIVMEFVPGETLHALLKRLSTLPTRVLVELLAEVASGLASAHAARDPASGAELALIHRDIKPANIMLTPQGEVKILDFGIARFRSPARVAMSAMDVIPGTLGYIAPERLLGRDLPASDIYALGVVLAQGLAGESSVPMKPSALVRGWRGEPARLGLLACQMLNRDPLSRPGANVVAQELADLATQCPEESLAAWAEQNVMVPPVDPLEPQAASPQTLLGVSRPAPQRGSSVSLAKLGAALAFVVFMLGCGGLLGWIKAERPIHPSVEADFVEESITKLTDAPGENVGAAEANQGAFAGTAETTAGPTDTPPPDNTPPPSKMPTPHHATVTRTMKSTAPVSEPAPLLLPTPPPAPVPSAEPAFTATLLTSPTLDLGSGSDPFFIVQVTSTASDAQLLRIRVEGGLQLDNGTSEVDMELGPSLGAPPLRVRPPQVWLSDTSHTGRLAGAIVVSDDQGRKIRIPVTITREAADIGGAPTPSPTDPRLTPRLQYRPVPR